MFDHVFAAREADELVNDHKPDSYYLSFILRKLPTEFIDLKESIPKDEALKNSLMGAKTVLEARESHLSEAKKLAGGPRANVASSGEGTVHGSGGRAFAVQHNASFDGICFKCGIKGHKAVDCNGKNNRSVRHFNQRGRGQGRGGRGRGRGRFQNQNQHHSNQQRKTYNQRGRGNNHNQGNRQQHNQQQHNRHANVAADQPPPHFQHEPQQPQQQQQQQHNRGQQDQNKRVRFNE